VVHVSWAALS